MSIKITATSANKFTKIEESIKELGEVFINKFEKAEYVMEGFNNDIKLVANNCFEKIIEIPKEFIINDIIFKEYFIYEKREQELEEVKKYSIEINGNLNKQQYLLVYIGLNKVNIEIKHSRL